MIFPRNMRGFIFFTECLVVLLLLFSCFCTDGQGINIECIPLENCPLLLKQVSKNKYALETIEFLKLSHCGYSKDKKPLVWCPDVNSCMTPDGTMGTCTDFINCPSLLNIAPTTNFLKTYMCNGNSESSVNVCCPEQRQKMNTRFNEYEYTDDPVEDDAPFISESRSTTYPSIKKPKSSQWVGSVETEEVMMGDQPHFSNEQKFDGPNTPYDDFPRNNHQHIDNFDSIHHRFDIHTTQGRREHPIGAYGDLNIPHGQIESGKHFEGSHVRNFHGRAEKPFIDIRYENEIESRCEHHFHRNEIPSGQKISPEENKMQFSHNRRKISTEIRTSTHRSTTTTARGTGYSLVSAGNDRGTESPNNIQRPTSSRNWGINRNDHNLDTTDSASENIFGNISSGCGRQSANDNKIIGGTSVELGEYPWMALLQYSSREGKKFGCGGTLISKRHILTAAHCVDDSILKARKLNLKKVVLGDYDTRNETDCIYLPFGQNCAPPPKSFGIESVTKHEKFNDVNGTDDIALITLGDDVEFTDYIKPICLPSVTFQMKTNETLTVAGWGRTSATGTEKFSPVLKKAKLPRVKKEDCSQHGRNLTDGQICAGLGNGIDTCTGDSGGPLILERAQNYEFVAYQIGVISYGFAAEGCGNAPSVNTYVPYYIDWIVKNIS